MHAFGDTVCINLFYMEQFTTCSDKKSETLFVTPTRDNIFQESNYSDEDPRLNEKIHDAAYEPTQAEPRITR